MEAANNIDGINKDKIVSEIPGNYSGLNTFITTFGTAVGSILVGIILTGGNAANQVILTITLASSGFFYLIAFLYLRRVKIFSR